MKESLKRTNDRVLRESLMATGLDALLLLLGRLSPFSNRSESLLYKK